MPDCHGKAGEKQIPLILGIHPTFSPSFSVLEEDAMRTRGMRCEKSTA
jgi:hypothetical protein